MSREQKAEIIDGLQETFSGCNIGILTDYRGLTATEMVALRSKLREVGIEYRVVKNTLARFAAQRAGKEGLSDLIEGPIAVAFGYGEIAESAKVLTEYIRKSQVELGIKGGFLSDRLLTSEEVKILSTLPPRDILLAKVVGGIQNPITALVNCLTNPMRGLVGLMQARIKQLEGE